jgi:2-succinyl-5-enolpyruvyl-6-hydroxy-3-cyclohexene-1-carboxylate synthase
MNKLLLTQNPGRLWASLIIAELVKNNCTHFFVSPGLRNVPLTAAIKNHPQAKIFSGIDERAQGFHALGYAKSSGEIAALLCTSGTAMANYFPAVLEAKKSGVPLVVISADRPLELVYSGANQTIPQSKIFSEFVQDALYLEAASLNVGPAFLTSSVAHLLQRSLFPTKGPVHLNVPFREPLEATSLEIPKDYLNKSLQALKASFSLIYGDNLNKFLDLFKSKRKTLLVLGPCEVGTPKEPLRKLVKNWDGPFYLDVCSGLKYEFNLLDGAIPSFDHPEVFNSLHNNPPDLILHLGGKMVSKQYYKFIENHPESVLVTVNTSLEKEDPANQTRLRYVCNPALWANKLSDHLPSDQTNYRFCWLPLVKKKSMIIDKGPLTYPKISKSLIDWIPSGHTLYLGNSTPIRSFDSYCSRKVKKDLNIIHHRGVSGIEGFIAGACGAAKATQKKTTLVLGDVSLIHDLNSLLLLQECENPPILLIVNNNGGGIFSLLPIDKEKEVMPYLTTPHDLNFNELSKQFCLNYQRVEDIHTLKENYLNALESKNPWLIEIIINNQSNKKIYERLKSIKL